MLQILKICQKIHENGHAHAAPPFLREIFHHHDGYGMDMGLIHYTRGLLLGVLYCTTHTYYLRPLFCVVFSSWLLSFTSGFWITIQGRVCRSNFSSKLLNLSKLIKFYWRIFSYFFKNTYFWLLQGVPLGAL